MTSNLSPLESHEQITLVQWLEIKELKFTAIPNSTYTQHMSVKLRNMREGVRAGFPDLIVLIAPDQAKDGTGRMLCIEMKRIKGGVVSQVQKEWAKAINGLDIPNIESIIAHGSAEAIDYITKIIK